MLNSYDLYSLGLYDALLKDIASKYPHLQSELGRDYSRLRSGLETRGLSFFMIDLADVGKHFDASLANQRLVPSGLPHQRPYKKGSVIPRLFKGLLLRVFNHTGELRTDCDVVAISFLRQLYSLVKKMKMECNDERKEKVLQSFFAVESGIRRGSTEWSYDDPEWPSASDVSFGQAYDDHPGPEGDLFSSQEPAPRLEDETLELIQASADIFSSLIGVFNPSEWRTKHGPGAVSDQKWNSTKYNFPSWPEKLNRIFPLEDFAFANYSCWADTIQSGEDSGRFSLHEYPSKLIMVPKTLKGPRLIASEPVAHQWCQQSLKDFFYRRVDRTLAGSFISFRDQAPNGVLAMSASRSGDLATIDLSEASDRVSLWCVERLFRRNPSVLDALHATRTRWCVNTISDKFPRFHKLRKFACMGSACTFPVESLLFLSIAIGATLSSRHLTATIENISSLKGEVRVFGDDIIVPIDAVEKVIGSLVLLGLKVNQQKTFYTGRFRESCGVDAFEGNDVTPGYVMTCPTRSRPESVMSNVHVANNFFRKGYRHVSNYIASAVRQVCSHIPDVVAGSGTFGLYDPGRPLNTHLRRRYCRETQSRQVRVRSPKGRVERSRDLGNSMLLQYFTEEPSFQDPWEGGFTSRVSTYLSWDWVDEELLYS